MGHWVFRNNTTHDDAVYIVRCVEKDGWYTVTGEWGKWSTYLKAGKLGKKVYLSTGSESSAKNACYSMLQERHKRHYYREQQYDVAMPWDAAAQKWDAAVIAATKTHSTSDSTASKTVPGHTIAGQPDKPASVNPGKPCEQPQPTERRRSTVAGLLEF